MTRFARFGNRNKPAHDASQWAEMKKGGNNAQPAGDIEPDKSKTCDTNGSPKSPLKGVMNDKVFKKSKHRNDKGKFSKDHSKYPGGGNKFKKGSKMNPGKLECYNCHKMGHKVSECLEPSDGKQLEVECYNCKKKGHKAFKCPEGGQRGPTKPKFMKIDQKKKQEWKANRGEYRRQKRQSDANLKLHCYNCREQGHKLSECPEIKKDLEQGTDICFKCGSTEHYVKQCNVKLAPGEYPYAKCFICGENGHLTQKCPDNPRGLYPNGGCCKECGSVEHLQRDCQEFQRQQGIESITLERLADVKSADQDDDNKEKPKQEAKSKGPKVVKF